MERRRGVLLRFSHSAVLARLRFSFHRSVSWFSLEKFVGAILCDRPSERADTGVCPYIDVALIQIGQLLPPGRHCGDSVFH